MASTNRYRAGQTSVNTSISVQPGVTVSNLDPQRVATFNMLQNAVQEQRALAAMNMADAGAANAAQNNAIYNQGIQGAQGNVEAQGAIWGHLHVPVPQGPDTVLQPYVLTTGSSSGNTLPPNGSIVSTDNPLITVRSSGAGSGFTDLNNVNYREFEEALAARRRRPKPTNYDLIKVSDISGRSDIKPFKYLPDDATAKVLVDAGEDLVTVSLRYKDGSREIRYVIDSKDGCTWSMGPLVSLTVKASTGPQEDEGRTIIIDKEEEKA
jgi:hypothetical protein